MVSAVELAVREASARSVVVAFTDGCTNYGMSVGLCPEVAARAEEKQIKIALVIPESDYHATGFDSLQSLIARGG